MEMELEAETWGGGEEVAYLQHLESLLASMPAHAEKPQTVKDLHDSLAATQWKQDPMAILIHSIDCLTIGNLKSTLSMMREQRELRTPKPVRDNLRCMLCWTPSSSQCSRCNLWALCATCNSELEGNCLQCLYEDQEDKAKARVALRISFDDASIPPH